MAHVNAFPRNHRLRLIILVLIIVTLCAPPAAHAATDITVYTDGLAVGWQDWSWNATTNFSNVAPARGSASIAVTYTAPNGGLSLRTSPGIDNSLYNAVAFWINGGTASRLLNFAIETTDNGTLSTVIPFTAPANTWTPVTITMAALGNPGQTARLDIQDASGAGGYTLYVDDIRLIGNGTSPLPITADIRIQAGGPITPVDARLLGSNIATWNGPGTYANTTFRARTAASGISVLRMPGGSYGNAYGWLSCEMGANQTGALPCGSGWESWAAKPTDFINFLRAVNVAGMWITSINGTAQEAAAAVAFFNAAITDTTSIGIDSKGFNWQTAGHWAQLRSSHGNPQPIGIKLWGVSNEVYGGKPGLGTSCTVAWGWEDVWTCDGTEYVNGKGSGASRHQGFNEFRTAMRAVDPTIQVGAIGVPVQNDWTNWGNNVIAAAGATMDFYDIHRYSYDAPPASYGIALADAQTAWSTMKANVVAGYNANAGGRKIPIGVTEFNLFSAWTGDTGAWMTQAVAGLFVADAIGQMATNGYAMSNQWLLSGNNQANGTDYGLIRIDNAMARSPQYFAYPLWARFGNQMLPLTSTVSAATQLSVYAGLNNAATYSVLAINKTGTPITTTISFAGAAPIASAKADVAHASALNATTMSFNGVSEGALADDLSNAPSSAVAITPGANRLTYPFAPYSITLLRFQTQLAQHVFLPLCLR